MRILHVIDSGGLYGAETVLLELASEQQRLGHSVAIASIGTPGCADKALESTAEQRGLRVVRVRMMDGPNPRGAWRLVQTARQERADVLHSHGYKPDILLGFMPRWLRGLPLVSTMHGSTYAGGLNRMALYRYLDLCALSQCDRVVAVHRHMNKVATLRGIDRRWRIIENGITPAEEDLPQESGDDPIAGFCKNGPIVGAVGRLSTEKGFDRLVLAFRDLLASGIQARLVIFGEGPQRERLMEQIRAAGIAEQVLLPGFVDVRRYWRLFDLLALPSLTEGLPIVLLEAMQAGVPVVASAVGGVPAVLQQGRRGVLVRPGDVAGLTEALRRMLVDPQLARQLAKRARDAVRQQYSSTRMARQYLSLYDELLAQRREPAACQESWTAGQP